MKCGSLMEVSSILHVHQQSWLQSHSQTSPWRRTNPTSPKSQQSVEAAAGAVTIVGAEVIEAEEVPDEAETPTIKVIIKVKVKISKTPSPIKKDQNILIYLPVLAGPAPSIGRKAVKLHTVVIHLSASGSATWFLVNLQIIEMLASLDRLIK